MPDDHRPSEDAVPVDSLGLDGFETGLLAVLRQFLTAYTRPETQAWQTAFALSAERWGAARGPQVAQGLLAVLQAMRQARRAEFRFANPLCPDCRLLATGEEAAFALMLHAMRRDRTDLARGAVMDLTEGTMDPRLIQSALAFAARFPAEAAAPLAGAGLAGAGLMERAPKTGPAPRHLRLVH